MGTVRYTTINGEVIAEKRSGVRRLYVPDPLGSTVALLDNTQTQVDTATYWPYGEVRTFTGTTPVPFQFAGTKGYYSDGYSTEAVGRTYVRARYLHTQKGRWLTQDPIGFDGDDFNLYRYVHNCPVTVTDPTGLGCPQSPPGACFWCHYQTAIRIGYSPQDACEVAKRLCPGSSVNCDNQMFCDNPTPDCQGKWEDCIDHCDGSYQKAYNKCRKQKPDPGDMKCKETAKAWQFCCSSWCNNQRSRCKRNPPEGPNEFDCLGWGTWNKPPWPWP